LPPSGALKIADAVHRTIGTLFPMRSGSDASYLVAE
jgi:hypothetical protein